MKEFGGRKHSFILGWFRESSLETTVYKLSFKKKKLKIKSKVLMSGEEIEADCFSWLKCRSALRYSYRILGTLLILDVFRQSFQGKVVE